MENEIQEVLVERRGGSNRVRILSTLEDRPQNQNRLAENLNLDYTTVQHHLDVLDDTGMLQCSGENYGAVYLLSDQARHHWDLIQELNSQMNPEDD